MQAVVLGAVTLLERVSCDGLWVEAEAFEKICADQEAQAAVLHRADVSAPPVEKRVSYRPCVRCGTMLIQRSLVTRPRALAFARVNGDTAGGSG